MAQSRFEEILEAIINGEECALTPQSRTEVLLLALLDTLRSGDGGSGGTVDLSDYYKKIEVDAALDTKVDKYIYSLYKPTLPGQLGDMVYRKNPVPGMNIGWVYTEQGWLDFGKVPNDNSELIDPSNNNEIIYKWAHQINPDNAEDFINGLYWGVEESDGNYTLKHKSELSSNIVKLSDVNGYRDDLLCDGITADTNVFLLGNTSSENDTSPNRKYSLNWILKAINGNLEKGDFKAIIELDLALLTPTKDTNRPNSGYDVCEIDFFESAVGQTPYLGILDDRNNGRMRTSGNEDRNGTTANFLYRYLGNFPLDRFVTLKFEIDGTERISIYIDDCLIDDDLNNPFRNDAVPTEDNECNFTMYFGDFDYLICREIRVMNLNPSKLEDSII